MRIQGLAGTAVSVAMVLSGAVRADAEIRTDGLSGRRLKTWRALVAVAEATGRHGQPLHPTLHRLYQEIEASAHVVRIVLHETRRTSAIAGRFRLESVAAEGRLEASLTLNLGTIERALTGASDSQLVGFGRLGRTERRAQVLGHELAHAAWTLSDPERVRLVWTVQQRSLELARRARTEGVAAQGFSDAVEANERLVRQFEEPALVAEAAIAEELRASR